MPDARRFRGEDERCGRSAAPPIMARCVRLTKGDWLLPVWTYGGGRGGPGSREKASAPRSLSMERSVDAAHGELATDEASYAAGSTTVDRGCSRGGCPDKGSELPKLSPGGVRPALEGSSLLYPAEKEKVGSESSVSQEGSATSAELSDA